MNTLEQQYQNILTELYISGKENVLEYFLHVYEKLPNESDLKYIQKCAILDYDDGQYQGAIFQEIFDTLDS